MNELLGPISERMDPAELGPAAVCRVCKQQTVIPNGSTHHLECSPMARDLCLGCFIFEQQLEVFLLRATGRSIWTFHGEDLIVGMLRRFEAGGQPVLDIQLAEEFIRHADERREEWLIDNLEEMTNAVARLKLLVLKEGRT